MMKRTLGLTLFTLLLFSSFGLSRPSPPDKMSQRLRYAYQSADQDDEFLLWIYFTDKGPDRRTKYDAVLRSLSLKSRRRRLTVRTPDALIDVADLPPEASYVETVRRHVRQIRHASKWLNGVSARATKRQIDSIQLVEFVKAIDLVNRFGKPIPEPIARPRAPEPAFAEMAQAQGEFAFDYGPSFWQLEQINVPAVHNLGNVGQGVVIGVFDGGFNNLDHEAFQQMNIIAARDFVNGDDDVGDGDDMGNGSHGTWTLSVVGGFAQGQLIGPAFGADFILAKTENSESETPREEDTWVAALEWAEGLGVDIISSSLGYLTFDRGFDGYTWRDMDGQTTVTTRAAVMAVARGVVVINSAGNLASNSRHNTLVAPADGDGVITVGAVNRQGRRAVFSSVGPTVDGRIKPDLMALGTRVRVASQSSRSGYLALGGTSFACPLVAGAAALMLSAHPDWSPTQVSDALRSTASNATRPNSLTGWGIVDALAAVRFGSQ